MAEAEPDGSGLKSEWEEIKWRQHKYIIVFISIVEKGRKEDVCLQMEGGI